MKQFFLLFALTFAGGLLALVHPFWGLLLYYTFAVLRPQYLWDWALPMQVRWSLIAAVIVLVSVALNMHRIIARGALNTVLVLMVLHGLLIMFSVLTSYYPGTAQHWGIEYAKILIIAGIACMVIDKLWQVRAVGLMILLTLGYIAWEVNYLYLFENHRLDIYHHGYGGFDNNGAGLMMGMAIPFAYAFAMGYHGRWRTAVMVGCAFLAGCLVHALLLSYSRGGMLAAAVGMGWLLMQHRPRMQSAAMVLALALALPVMAGPEVRERFFSIGAYEEDRSAQSRLDSWAAALRMVQDNPILGKGVRNANYFSQNYGADYEGRTIHNQYLQLAADSGLPAAILYIAMMAVAMWNLHRVRARCLVQARARSLLDDPDVQEMRLMEKVCLAIQSSLLMFLVGACFLSLEAFELPWLLVVLAGLLPMTMQRWLDNRAAPSAEAEHPPAAHLPNVAEKPEPRLGGLGPGHMPGLPGAST